MRLDDTDRVPLIVATVVSHLHAAEGDVYGHDKHARPSMVRHISWACAWMLTKLPMAELATMFDREVTSLRGGVDRYLWRERGGVTMEAHGAFVAALRECEFAIADQEARMTEVLG